MPIKPKEPYLTRTPKEAKDIHDYLYEVNYEYNFLAFDYGDYRYPGDLLTLINRIKRFSGKR